MSRRRTSPDTGEPELTHREQIFINEYIKNGGNATEAAIASGYGSARPNQSAYQVLHRLRVQQHINDRVAESTVSADEIIGTLAAFMRGRITDILDDNGDFDINVVRERRLGHLLKTVTRTTRKLESQPGQDPEFVQDYRIQLHSPVQAASILARLTGLNRKNSDLPSDHIAAEETSPDTVETSSETHVETSASTQGGQVGNLPYMSASWPVGHARASLVPDSSPDSSNLASIDAPAPQPADLPSATSQPSPGSPQPSPLQKLRRIGRRIMNLRKINATQCLENNSTQSAAPSSGHARPPDHRRLLWEIIQYPISGCSANT